MRVQLIFVQGVEEPPAMEGNNGEVSLLDGQDAINPFTPLEPKQPDNCGDVDLTKSNCLKMFECEIVIREIPPTLLTHFL